MRSYFVTREQKAVAAAQQRYAVLAESMARLAKAGAKVILGADTGLEDHLFGMAEQLELQAMVDAGLTPEQGITAATSRAAEFLRLPRKGSLKAGFDADFLVLNANPLDDIRHAARIARTIVNGVETDRRTLSAALTP
jgi:imidazolonepropionase-like amidohydrolase